jgi:hypothetical protein
MTNVGITGHQRIPAEALGYVTQGIRDCLVGVPESIVGFSSLALGADQLFAQAVLDAGGSLIAVIPCERYDTTFAPEDLPVYQALLDRATDAVVLDFPEPSEAAFVAAGQEVIRRSELLIAIWDGQPAAGLGGTGDAVAHAKSLGKRVQVIWPEGVRR